jgi:ribonuclease P protein component
MVYVFPREESESAEPGEARLGLAVSKKVGGAVARNRLKRRLRAALDELAGAAASGHDYVVAARPGLAEAAEARGFPWLVERVAEALELVRAPNGGAYR